MSLDIGKMAGDMGAAFLNVLKDKAPDIEKYAKDESAKMAQSLAKIASLLAAGKIDEDEAKLQLNIQKQATKAVLLAIAGVSLLAAEAAINAALATVKTAVNTAVGFALIA
jgi:hypothetical protein